MTTNPMEDDTETLISLVSSLLLPQHEFSQDHILDILVQFSGNVETAAAHLNQSLSSSSEGKSGGTISSSRKRKRSSGLDAWLKPPSKETTRTKEVQEQREPLPQKIRVDAKLRSLPNPSGSSGLSVKPAIDFMAILKQPPSPEKMREKQKPLPRLQPLVLSSPALVAQHTPCTLHLSVLPPELACELFYTMVDASKVWKRNKWWLFDRLVESPHLTSFFARRTNGLDDDESWHSAAQYWYNGRMTDAPATFPEPMERACQIVEKVVNEEMAERKRYDWEWGGGREGAPPMWRANVAASNCYKGSKESVGWHSDSLTYLGPHPTIASLSLGTRRNFSLREVIPIQEADIRRARTFNIPLPHNSLTIMHASCQEKFKHSIPPQGSIDLYRPAYPRECSPNASITNVVIEPSNCRINITFRFYRPDFRPETIPKCHCGIPTILRPDMKRRTDGETDRYWWACFAGAQNEGKGCSFWKVLDMKAEGRGPCVGDLSK